MVYKTGGLHYPDCLLLFSFLCPWLQQDPCSWGCPSHHPCALGNGSRGQLSPPHRKTLPVSCSSQCRPPRPFPPGTDLSFVFYLCFFLLLNNEFSIPHHGPDWSLHRSMQPSSLLCACTSKKQSGDGADRAGPASCCSLHVVAFSVTTFVSPWLSWGNPNLSSGQGL